MIDTYCLNWVSWFFVTKSMVCPPIRRNNSLAKAIVDYLKPVDYLSIKMDIKCSITIGSYKMLIMSKSGELNSTGVGI